MLNNLYKSLCIHQRFFHGSIINQIHKASYKSEDSNIDTDEIISENNPWSPTLLNDTVKVRQQGTIFDKKLPSNYRLSYQPLYEAPGTKYVSLLKRLTISFGVLGCYGAKLFYDSPHFDDIYALITLSVTNLPILAVQYKLSNYVTRIFRLYNKDKPQTLDNLINDENLIIEKLNFTGGKTYNTLVKVSDNDSLKLIMPSSSKIRSFLTPYGNWQDGKGNSIQKFYISDDIGGIKMDRIWGIVEKNSGVDNGRFLEDKVH